MKRMMIGLVLLWGISVSHTWAGQEMVDVCHMTAPGEFQLITIADPAYDSHINHGDAAPGEIVPGSGDQFEFGPACEMVALCPCSADLEEGWTPTVNSFLSNASPCSDGTLALSGNGSMFNGTGQSIRYGFVGNCDGSTTYYCQASGGVERTISEIQYSACEDLLP